MEVGICLSERDETGMPCGKRKTKQAVKMTDYAD